MEKSYFYGGFWLRVAATFLDGIVLIIISGVINMAMGLKFFATSADPTSKEMFAGLFTMTAGLLYFSIFQALMSGTLGKRALGLMLVDAKDYSQISIGQSIGRYFMMGVSTICFGIGLFIVGVNKRKQGWHDSVAGTVVVKKKLLDKLKLESGIFPKKADPKAA